MKITFLNNIPTPYRKPLFRCIAQMLNDRGFDFEVVYLAKTEQVRDWKVELAPNESILPVLFQFRNPFSTTSDFIFNRIRLHLFLDDIVVMFGYNYIAYLFVALTRFMLGHPTILFCETTINDTARSVIKQFIKKKIFRLFSKFIVPGIRSKEYLEAHGVDPSRIYIANNASNIRSEERSVRNYDDTVRFLFVGRLAEEKRIVEFARIFEAIGSHHLTIVGDGPLRPMIEDLCSKACHVKYVGWKNELELPEIFHAHDVLVLVSVSETWGLVVNEGINFGLALLLSNEIGSAPELLDGNGVKLAAICEKEIRDAIIFIQKNLAIFQERSFSLSTKYTTLAQAEQFIVSILDN